MLDITKLNDRLVSELRVIAQSLGIADVDTLRKPELIAMIENKNCVKQKFIHIGLHCRL